MLEKAKWTFFLCFATVWPVRPPIPHADEWVFYLCNDWDIGWRAYAFVWPRTLKMSQEKRRRKIQREKSRRRELIKIFFDRFSNLEIIFFSLPLLRTRRIYLSIYLLYYCYYYLVHDGSFRFVCAIIADSVYLSSGVCPESGSACSNGFLPQHIQRHTEHMNFSPLIWVSSAGKFSQFNRKTDPNANKSYTFIGVRILKFPYY